MGQQQLLLVILVTIIVGIATVVAINTFGAAADDANVQATIQDLAQIGASAQSYYMRPEMLGGGGRDFDGITWNDIAFGASDIDGTEASNENATFTLPASTAGDEFIVTAVPAQAGGGIQARICADDVRIGDYNPDDESGTAPDACGGGNGETT